MDRNDAMRRIDAILQWARDVFASQRNYSLRDALACGETPEQYAGELYQFAVASSDEVCERLGFWPTTRELRIFDAELKRLCREGAAELAGKRG